MSLTGTFERTLDDKLRLAIPRSLRDGFSSGETEDLYLARGNEGCLSLYSAPGFESLASRLASLSTGTANVRNFLRLFYSQAERVSVDKQCRIRIPDRLARLAALSHEIVLIGVHDHVEIWDRQRWDSLLSQHESQFDELTARALEYPLPSRETSA